jgi:hypothetical protein
MIKAVLAVALIGALASVYLSSGSMEVSMDDQFQNFVQTYRRSYFSKDEYKLRQAVFTANVKKAAA